MLHRRPGFPFRPPGEVGMLVYMGLMTMLNTFGVITIGRAAYRISESWGLRFEFYLYWFNPEA